MYDHNTKAGNQGDVVKHPALIAALDIVLQDSKPKSFHFLDAFAGYAHNPIVKGNDWSYGIGHIHSRGRSTDNPHVKTWMSLWPVGRQLVGGVYLGSSLFSQKICQNHDVEFHGSLFDISPNVISQLMSVFHNLDVQINTRSAKPKDLDNKVVDFVFLDPPGIRSDKNPCYPSIEELTAFIDGKHHIMVWLPMVADLSTKPPTENDNSRSWRKAFTDRGLSSTTVRWNAGGPICGCQILYRLPVETIAAVRAAIDATLTLTDWATKNCEHLDQKTNLIG